MNQKKPKPTHLKFRKILFLCTSFFFFACVEDVLQVEAPHPQTSNGLKTERFVGSESKRIATKLMASVPTL
ncbi:MAG: hypothetical protein ACOVLC_05125 [Flavobacterium sp.]